MMPLLFQSNLEQPDFSFPNNHYTSKEIRSLPEPLDRFKNVRPVSPVVSLENATKKERNLNIDQNYNTQLQKILTLTKKNQRNEDSA